MLSRGYSSEAIILSKKNYDEADRILIVYSKNFGQLRLVAKGIRKPKSRKRGHLEIFSYIKFSAVRGKFMDIITEAEAIDTFDEIRHDLKKITVAYYVCEILGKLTRDGEKNDRIFSDSLNFLRELKISKRLRTLRKRFVTDLMISMGFWTAGKELEDPDKFLEEVIERRVNSVRVGKALLM
jgi:DNA repair protein RecO (recombination protein O)